MGPHEGMRQSVDEAPDWVAEMRDFLEAHKGVRFLPGTGDRWPAAIVGDEKVEREHLRDLVLYLRARLEQR